MNLFEFDWTMFSVLTAFVDRDGKRLSVSVTPVAGMFQVVAVTTTDKAETISDIFDDHGHEVVGSYVNIPRAMRAAEDRAMTWLNSHKKDPTCECGPIQKQQTKKRRSVRKPTPAAAKKK